MSTVAGMERYFTSAEGLRLFYRNFAPLQPSVQLPVLCLPGLTRNSRDFTHVVGARAITALAAVVETATT